MHALRLYEVAVHCTVAAKCYHLMRHPWLHCIADVAHGHAYGAMPDEICTWTSYSMLQGVSGAAAQAWQLWFLCVELCAQQAAHCQQLDTTQPGPNQVSPNLSRSNCQLCMKQHWCQLARCVRWVRLALRHLRFVTSVSHGCKLLSKQGCCPRWRQELTHAHPHPLAVRPCRTPESEALSAALKKAGMTFVGPTIMYAFMQAAGLVDDHLASCHCRSNT